MFYFIFLFSILSNISIAAPYNNLLDVKDFIESLTDGNDVAKDYLNKNPENLKFFQEQYEAKKPSKMPYVDEPLIPKVMHQIWFGSDIPPLYMHYLNECKKLHPDWAFKIWNAKDIADLNWNTKIYMINPGTILVKLILQDMRFCIGLVGFIEI